MALLAPSEKEEKTQLKIKVDSDIVTKVKAYCDYAGITQLDEFFQKAAEFVMSKDKDWRKQIAAE